MEDADALLQQVQDTMDIEFQSKVVLPGDDVTSIVTNRTKSVKLGPGLVQDGDTIRSTHAGLLRYRLPNRYWIEFNKRRVRPCSRLPLTLSKYQPMLDDAVIGLIEDRNVDFYRVNLAGSGSAMLPVLAFDGASKRNRPNLHVGTIVYGRVHRHSTQLGPTLSCEATASMPKKDWMTGQSVFGELKGGLVFRCSIALCKRLLAEEHGLLQTLGEKLAFECAIGVNGLIWIDSKSPKQTILVYNAILNAEHLTDEACPAMARHLLASHYK